MIREDFPTPLYYQIYIVLRDKIMAGDISMGASVPSENELARDFRVSRITARRALKELADDELVQRQRGKGTFVTYNRSSSVARNDMDGLLEDLLMIVIKTKVKILAFDYIPASREIAKALQIPHGTKVQHTIRTRHKNKKPFSYVEAYIPEEIGRLFKKSDIKNQPLLALIEKTGVNIASASQIITAVLADIEIATQLDVKVGTALLKVERTVYDADGRPVEFINVFYRPDNYQIRQNLARVKGKGKKSNFWHTESL